MGEVSGLPGSCWKSDEHTALRSGHTSQNVPQQRTTVLEDGARLRAGQSRRVQPGVFGVTGLHSARRGFSPFSSGGLLRAFALLTCIPTPEGGQTAATSKPRPLEQRSPTPVAPGTSSSYAHLPPDGIRWSRGGEAGAGRAGEAAHKAGLVLVSGQSPSTAAEKHNLASDRLSRNKTISLSFASLNQQNLQVCGTRRGSPKSRLVHTNRIPRNICDRLCPAPPARVSSRSGEDGPGKQTARPPHFTARSTGATGGEGLAQVPPPARGEAGLHTQEAWHLSLALGRLCVSPANSLPPPTRGHLAVGTCGALQTG